MENKVKLRRFNFELEGRVDREEHDAWIQMFKKMAEVFKVTEKELNKEKYKPIFIEIERWAFYYKKRIETLKKLGQWNDEWDNQGVFWEGD